MCVKRTPILVLTRKHLIGPSIRDPQTDKSYWSIFIFGVVPWSFFLIFVQFFRSGRETAPKFVEKEGFWVVYRGFFVNCGSSVAAREFGFFFKRKPVQNHPPVRNFRVLASFVREIFADKCFLEGFWMVYRRYFGNCGSSVAAREFEFFLNESPCKTTPLCKISEF